MMYWINVNLCEFITFKKSSYVVNIPMSRLTKKWFSACRNVLRERGWLLFSKQGFQLGYIHRLVSWEIFTFLVPFHFILLLFFVELVQFIFNGRLNIVTVLLQLIFSYPRKVFEIDQKLLKFQKQYLRQDLEKFYLTTYKKATTPPEKVILHFQFYSSFSVHCNVKGAVL